MTAVLNPETVSELIAASSPPAFARRRSATIKDPKGSVTFQIPNGVLTEFTLKLGGSREFFDRELKLDRTITTSITGIGTTRLDLPDDAKEIVDALIAGRRSEVFVPEPGFRKLFDGRTLAGWEGQPGFWSVRGSCHHGPDHEGKSPEEKHVSVCPAGRQRLDRRRLRAAPFLPHHRRQRPGLCQLGHPVPQPEPGRISSRPATRRTSRLARGTRASSMTRPAAPAGAGSWPSAARRSRGIPTAARR